MNTSPERPIDWTSIAMKLGSIEETAELGGDQLARDALNILLGPEQLRLAVGHYLDVRPGFELVRSVLSLLRSPEATHECYRVYRESRDLERRRKAVELLRIVADATALPWVDELLDDEDAEVRAWGAGVLDYLVFRDLVDTHVDTVEALLGRLESDESERVRQRAEQIASMLAGGEDAG